MNNAKFAKLVLMINGLVPLAMMSWDVSRKNAGANPIEFVLHTTGTLALIFLALSLLITPLRKITGVNFFSHFRRMLGLLAFFYAALHLLTYVGSNQFNLPIIIDDTLSRPFISIGMASFAVMIPLAWTSTNAAIKKLGAKKWKALHRLAYAAAAGRRDSLLSARQSRHLASDRVRRDDRRAAAVPSDRGDSGQVKSARIGSRFDVVKNT